MWAGKLEAHKRSGRWRVSAAAVEEFARVRRHRRELRNQAPASAEQQVAL
jgi:hypothetical protein